MYPQFPGTDPKILSPERETSEYAEMSYDGRRGAAAPSVHCPVVPFALAISGFDPLQTVNRTTPLTLTRSLDSIRSVIWPTVKPENARDSEKLNR